jgi:hypothetical protein
MDRTVGIQWKLEALSQGYDPNATFTPFIE